MSLASASIHTMLPVSSCGCASCEEKRLRADSTPARQSNSTGVSRYRGRPAGPFARRAAVDSPPAAEGAQVVRPLEYDYEEHGVELAKPEGTREARGTIAADRLYEPDDQWDALVTTCSHPVFERSCMFG